MAVPNNPTSNMPISISRLLFAQPTMHNAAINNSCCTANSRWRLMRSPSGTTNTSANAQPSWVAVITLPTDATLIANAWAMASNNGWA
ncbi:hypothetical protein D3C77_712380 [compost metagenome]